MNLNYQLPKILLVEDSEADIDLIKYALKKNSFQVDLDIVTDGQEALDYLNKKGHWEKTHEPNLVLLDINLPGINVIEVLQQIKENPQTRHIPILILTSSDQEKDILRAYDNHANSFLQKPLDIVTFQDIVGKIEEFWLSIIKLPPVNSTER